MIKFEWNQTKAKSNKLKHGIAFEEAISVFYDKSATVFYDGGNSVSEDRYLILGYSNQLRILLTSFHEEQTSEVVRIISARKATANEAKQYAGDEYER